MIQVNGENKTLALCLIMRNEVEEVEKLLAPISKYFDEIIITVNNCTNPKSIEVAEKYGTSVNVITGVSHPDLFIESEFNGEVFIDPDFEKLRNFNFNQAKSDYLMWLDADDTLPNHEELVPTIQEAFSNPDVSHIFMKYNYDHNDSGQVVMVHWRERIVKRGFFEWKGSIHEVLLPIRDGRQFRTNKIFVEHQRHLNRVPLSASRNLRVSKAKYEEDHTPGNFIDARNVLNYAKSLNATGFFADAEPIFEEYLRESDWDDERYQVLLILADLYIKSRQFHKAIEMATKAIALRPTYALGYYSLAKVNFNLEKWNEVVHLVNLGMKSECPSEVIPIDPMDYQIRPFIILEFSLFNLGLAEQSLQVIEKALAFQPDNEYLKERKKTVIAYLSRMEIEEASLKLHRWLSTYEPEKNKQYVSFCLPKIVEDHPKFVRARNEINSKGFYCQKRLVVYCGPTFETWGPEDVITKGLGGSEEAVVYLTKYLSLMGWVVDVYSNCNQPTCFNGVNYKNFWEFDSTQDCEIFIAWRNSEYLELAPDKSKAFLWCHDVQKMEYYTQSRIDRVEKIMMLSKWHRENLKDIPDDKFFLTRNGIISSDFDLTGKINRDPYKCVYASSPDRGLDVLLEEWPKIKKACPKAHLHVFYGFTKTYDKLHASRDRMIKFKEHILKKLETMDGVFYHGKVPHSVLHEHMMSAGLWLYPTYFTEISCITAMKAQASGAIPVCTSLAALDETVQYGYKISFHINDTRSRQSFTNMTIELLNNHSKQEKIRNEMMGWAKQHYDWRNVADEWDKLFKETMATTS